MTTKIFHEIRDPVHVFITLDSADLELNPEAGKAVSQALTERYGQGKVKLDSYGPSGHVFDFPVLQFDGRIVSSPASSDLLRRIPTAAIDFVFVEPSIRGEAMRYIHDHRNSILAGNGG